MHAAIRPYITTGVALVGAGVIAVSPLAPPPTNVQSQSPAVAVYQAGGIDLLAKRAGVLQLYANVLKQAGVNTGDLVVSFVDDPLPIVGQITRNLLGSGQDLGRAFGDALRQSGDALRNDVPPLLQQARDQFQSGDVSGGVDSLLAAIVAPLTPFTEVGGAIATALGEPFANLGRVITAVTQPQFVTGVVLSMIGPVISTVGATAVAIQHIFEAFGGGVAQPFAVGTREPGAVIRAIAAAPAIILDGLLNGGYGPDLSPLLLGRPTSTEESAALIQQGRVLAGGLLSGLALKRAEAPAERAAALAEGDRILPGPIGGIQAVRLTVARAISPRVKAAAAADPTVAQGNSVTLAIAPDDSRLNLADPGDVGAQAKVQTDSNAKRAAALSVRAPRSSVKPQTPSPTKASDGVGKPRKAAG